jgi:hypothetical protein
MKIILAFIVLQLADFGTTLGAIALGGSEQNPVVGHLMGLGVWEGLAISKLIVFAIGAVAAYCGRYGGLRKMNVAFVAIVAWNVTIIGRLMIA